MTASILKPQLRHALLRNLNNAKQSGKKNWLQKGFTLVELMIVIVIVGILSAVALPNFLSQTSRAKATECTTRMGAVLSQAGAEGLGVDTVTVKNATMSDIASDNDSDLCTFTSGGFDSASEIYTLTVVGKTGSALDGVYSAKACVNAATGVRKQAIKTDGTTPDAPSCA